MQKINPFHDLYLTEAIGTDRFVQLFSPVVVQHGLELFQPGNVILKGLQGSGKTMLLNLLKPDIRLAYRKANVHFPVPDKFSKFISAGINLRKSGISEFSQLLHDGSEKGFESEIALFFGDFLNYWVIDDLLRTIDIYIASGDDDLLSSVGLVDDKKLLDKFAKHIAIDDCWFGYFDGVSSFPEFREYIRKRISVYRKYINLNIDELPPEIKKTKTVIGEPISKLAEALRLNKIIDDDVNVYVRIDQYEELPTLDMSGMRLGTKCQEIIHKALSSRDPRVSYRIGTRQYAWPETPVIYSTKGSLELKRDFSVVSIDEILRRKENVRTWIFPAFAQDIFSRRLKLTDYKQPENKVDLLEEVFGSTKSASERAKSIAPNPDTRKSIIKVDKGWPESWISFLNDLAREDPISAKFAESWVRQRGADKRNIIFNIPSDKFPWDAKKYWKKERSEQALVQIASRNKQQMIWAGKEDVLGISGGNILVFLYLCQQIWDAWLRDTRTSFDAEASLLPTIDEQVQSIGVLNASEEWLKKPREGEFSVWRTRFIHLVGKRYYKLLTDDVAMSNPGWNGFSVNVDELERHDKAEKFLNISVDYGDLYDSPHTSKVKGEKRRKYYLAPIFCPAFGIPYKHTKEPEYISLKELTDWMEVANNASSSSDLTYDALRNLNKPDSQGELDF